jgi:hypothetical protein
MLLVAFALCILIDVNPGVEASKAASQILFRMQHNCANGS